MSTDAKVETRSQLKGVLEEFPESPGAKLEAVRKFDNKAKQSQRKKERGINIGLNLVGMLRPPGNGGLQGFIGYSTGLFGLPLDLLLGIHNDGDSPEVFLFLLYYFLCLFTHHSRLNSSRTLKGYFLVAVTMTQSSMRSRSNWMTGSTDS